MCLPVVFYCTRRQESQIIPGKKKICINEKIVIFAPDDSTKMMKAHGTNNRFFFFTFTGEGMTAFRGHVMLS